MGSPRRALALFACAGLVGLWALAWCFTVDDAYIAGTYARRLALGLGYTFRAGPPTDGVTGPLWLIPLVVGAWIGCDPVASGKAVGGACAVLAVWLAIAHMGGRAFGRARAVMCGGLCLSSVPLASWSVAGLETGAATLAATLLSLAMLRNDAPSGALAGACAAALAWLRPELACFSAVLLVAVWSRDEREGQRAWALAVLGVASVLAFRFVMFRHLLPMSVFAKGGSIEDGMSYLLRALVQPAFALPALALVLTAASLSSRERYLAGALCAHALAIVLAGGDWMAGFRLFAPVVPSAAVLFALAFSRSSARRPHFVWAFFALLFSVRAAAVVRELGAAREAGTSLARTARQLASSVQGAHGPLVALDVGSLSYFQPSDVVDLGGLTEPHIAYARGGHLDKSVDRLWLAAQRPDFIILHSRERPRVDELGRLRWFSGYPVERRVLAMPWVMNDCRVGQVIEHSPAYFYAVLQCKGRIPR